MDGPLEFGDYDYDTSILKYHKQDSNSENTTIFTVSNSIF